MGKRVLSARFVVSARKNRIRSFEEENLEVDILFLHVFESVLQIIEQASAPDVYSKGSLLYFLIL